MSRAGDYLCIPADYVECLEGLRWSEAGDAVETAAGNTFAVSQEIALFLEGFASQRPLIHFGHVLHFLHLLKRGGTFATLRHAYEGTHRSARNAGVLCARLCDRVPGLADPPPLVEVWHALMSSCYVASLGGALPVDAPGSDVELPPLGPLTFEERILRALWAYTDDELHDWFSYGQGPVKEAGASLARAVADLRPRSLAGVLANLAQRERLAGAVPFVAQLVSALTLPPRRLQHEELPMGGYADVTTRGHPEQVLPSQLVLEDLEFVRRFAANELLYFRREEPHARLREELVVLLDQGVRTWGVVRLVLSAAFFAFGKLAQRRKLRFQVATTGTSGRLTDPLEAEDQALGALLEASDLSPHPGLALERVLEGPNSAARDVVLLTHPRSSREADVLAAARRVTPGTRLFAVTVDDQGSVELSELRHGTPVSLTSFRLDLTKSTPVPKLPERVREMSVVLPSSAWSGDVEPIGFPFRFGLPGNVSNGLFDFDSSGDWLLIACQRGMLYAARTDGSGTEMLPRGFLDNQLLLQSPHAVLGVAGGFVVTGELGNRLVAFHYDFAARTCRAYKLAPSTRQRWEWCYVSKFHSIVARAQTYLNGLDLGTGESFFNEGKPFHPNSRVRSACRLAQNRVVQTASVDIFNVPSACFSVHPPAVSLNSESGEVMVYATESWNFTPYADGRPALRGARILQARYQGKVLALFCATAHSVERFRLYVYRGPSGTLLYEVQRHQEDVDFTLSRDGVLIALVRKGEHSSVQLRDVSRGGAPVKGLRLGRFHHDVVARLGTHALLAGVGQYKHLLQWKGDRLEHRQVPSLAKWPSNAQTRANPANYLSKYEGFQRQTTPEMKRLLDSIRADSRRFVDLSIGPLRALVDCFGQMVLLDRGWNLLCMFFIFRSVVAAWMPDGTRYGPAWLTGGPETPGAAEKIARRLQQASSDVEGSGTFQFDASGGLT
jgi:hypothetical protein